MAKKLVDVVTGCRKAVFFFFLPKWISHHQEGNITDISPLEHLICLLFHHVSVCQD